MRVCHSKVAVSFCICLSLCTNLLAEENGNGSFAEAILATISLYSKKLERSDYTPPLQGHWTKQTDRYGTVFQSKDVSFRDFFRLIQSVYGKPQQYGKASPDGKIQFAIPANRAGAGVIFSDSEPGVTVTILKPFHLPKKL